jgi:farnesyl-diphosphate farnesyltransferase
MPLDSSSLDAGNGLPGVASFNRYCYHVAGVVGEMLTELYCNHNAVISRRREVMMPLAVSFGQGLQLTNILKDVWNDLDRGACWLPQTLMIKHGIEPQLLSAMRGSDAVDHLLGKLLAIAHGHLQDALCFTLLIPSQETGLRRFCLWAIGTALLTLQRLRKNSSYRSSSEVKISRSSLKLSMVLCNAFNH